MGCTISPILFLMAMEVFLKTPERYAGPTDLGDGCEMHPQKAFMGDITIMCSAVEETKRILNRSVNGHSGQLCTSFFKKRAQSSRMRICLTIEGFFRSRRAGLNHKQSTK